MSKLKVTSFISFALVLILLAACSGGNTSDEKQESNTSSGEKITIKIGHPGNGTESDPYLAYTDKFTEVLDAETDGRIELQVFPNSQLGDLNSMMEQVNNGDLDMTTGQNTGILAEYYSNIQVLDLPYAFESLEIAQEVLGGEFGDKIKGELEEDSNLKLMSFMPSSFRNFGNNKHPITSPEDLKGLTMRVMEVPVHQEMIKALGAVPQVISFEELYSALQTGVIDGHEQAPYVLLMNTLEEVTKYYTIDRHVLNTAVSLINQDFYNNLSEEDQEVLKKAEQAAAQALLDHVETETAKDMEKIIDAGVEVTELDSDQFMEFQNVVIEPVSEYLETQIDKEIIDEMLEAIEAAK